MTGREGEGDGIDIENDNDSDAVPSMDDQLNLLKNQGFSVHFSDKEKKKKKYMELLKSRDNDRHLQKQQLTHQHRQQQHQFQRQLNNSLYNDVTKPTVNDGLNKTISKNNSVYTIQSLLSNSQQTDKPLKQTVLNTAGEKIKTNNKNNKQIKNANAVTDVKLLETLDMEQDVMQNNRFAILSDLEIKTTTTMHAETHTQGVTNNYAVDNTINRQSNIEVQEGGDLGATPSGRFCPPIILYNVNINDLVLQFRSKFPNVELKIVNISRLKSKLYIKDFRAYSEMMALLKEKKVNSHSFTHPQNKQLSVVLRGLHHMSAADDIKADLDVLLPGIVSGVQVFTTPYMRKNNVISNLFLVTLLPGSSLKDLINIKYLSYQKITWEKPHSFNKEVQCKRCQRWGHIAKNCNHAFQCVKCDMKHEPGRCQLSKEEGTKPYCINCKTWGHPANFRGCEAFKLYSTKKLSTTRQTSKSISTDSNNGRSAHSRVSYASVLHKNSKQNPTKNSSIPMLKEFMELAREILAPEPLTLEKRIQNFMQNFSTMSLEDRKNNCKSLLREIQSLDG